MLTVSTETHRSKEPATTTTGGPRPTTARRLTWPAFEKRLAKALSAMEPDTFLVLETMAVEGAAMYYVQFAMDPDQLRAETVGSEYRPDQPLTTEQEGHIRDLGWTPPADGEKGRNPYRMWDAPVPVAEVAALAVQTLRSVYDVQEPASLRFDYRTFTPANGAPKPLPSLGIEPMPAARPVEARRSGRADKQLRSRVEKALSAWLGGARIVRDDDGDYPIRVGSAICYLRILEGVPPAITVFSPVLQEVAVTPDLRVALDDLNGRIRYGRVFTAGRTVLVAMELPAIDLTPEHVVFACQELGALADSLDDTLRGRFGGRVAFDTSPKLLN